MHIYTGTEIKEGRIIHTAQAEISGRNYQATGRTEAHALAGIATQIGAKLELIESKIALACSV